MVPISFTAWHAGLRWGADVVARLGGDEFAVLLPASVEALMDLAEVHRTRRRGLTCEPFAAVPDHRNTESMAESPSLPLTVLVVGHQGVTRRLAQRILSEAGYRVFEAADSTEALDVLGRTASVDLVLIDVVMLRLTGTALVRQLADEWPRQRVLYMSADPAHALAQYQAPHLRVSFLAKPFTRRELLVKVEEAIQATVTPVDQRSP